MTFTTKKLSSSTVLLVVVLATPVSTTALLSPIHANLSSKTLGNLWFSSRAEDAYASSSPCFDTASPQRIADQENQSFLSKSSPSTTEQEENSEEHGMNTALMRDLLWGQIGLATLAACLSQMTIAITSSGSRLSHEVFSSTADTSASAITPGLTQGVYITVVVQAMIVMESFMEQMAPRPTRRVHFDTNNLVVTLWGRRAKATRDTEAISSSKTTTTMAALGPTIFMAAVTALAQQIIFFHFLPLVLLQVFHVWPVISVLGPALAFGVYHWSPKARSDENQVLCTQHTLHGLLYTTVIAICGLPASIMAQMLYNSHIWTTIWHDVNDQIDWAHEASFTLQSLSDHDKQVWEALQAHSKGALTEHQEASLQRFFFAFDRQRRGYLSLNDVQNAMAYSFWNSPAMEPSPSHVEALFWAILDERPDKDDVSPPDRLSWVECVRLLVSLRAASRVPPRSRRL